MTGEILKQYRRYLGKSQEEVASGASVKQQSISYMERRHWVGPNGVLKYLQGIGSTKQELDAFAKAFKEVKKL